MKDLDKTEVAKTEQCSCHDCVQFGLSIHPVDADQEERTAYTVRTYGALPIKPNYSPSAFQQSELLRAG